MHGPPTARFQPMAEPISPHPLAEPFATALFAPEEPDPVDFVMLLTEVSQLPAPEYAQLWSQVVGIGRGVPVQARERAEYVRSAPDRVSQAEKFATLLGEMQPGLQILVIRTLRLMLLGQMRKGPRPEPAASGEPGA
jgi:hypothetical protein